MLHSDKRDGFRIEIVLGAPVVESPNPLYIDSLLGALNEGKHQLALDDGAILGSRVFFLDKFDTKTITSFRRGYTRKPPTEKIASEFLREDGLLVTGKRIGTMSHKPSLGSGKLKSYGGENTYITPRWYSHAVAWAVGDKEAVKEVLLRLSHIGAKTRLGYGAVMHVAVFDDDSAEQHCYKRVLPADHPQANSNDYAKAFISIKGPYWDSQNRQMAQIYCGGCPDFDLKTESYTRAVR